MITLHSRSMQMIRLAIVASCTDSRALRWLVGPILMLVASTASAAASVLWGG